MRLFIIMPFKYPPLFIFPVCRICKGLYDAAVRQGYVQVIMSGNSDIFYFAGKLQQ